MEKESLGASARVEVRKQIIQINAISQTAGSQEPTSRQNWFTEGKKWAVRDSRSDSFRIKFKLSPNKYSKQTIKSKHIRAFFLLKDKGASNTHSNRF